MLFNIHTSSHGMVLLLLLSTGGSAKPSGNDEGGSLSPQDFEKAKQKNVSGGEVHDEDGSPDLFEGDILLTDNDRDAMDRGIGMREVVSGDNRKWPVTDGLVYVPYTIPSDLDEDATTEIARAILEFDEKTCIR